MKKLYYLILVSICAISSAAQSDSITVIVKRMITDSAQNFNYALEYKSGMYNTTPVGDVDGNGVIDIVVGAPFENSGKGYLYLMLLEKDLSLKSVKRLENNRLYSELRTDDRLGMTLSNIGDINGDGYDDLASGAPQTDDGYNNSGAIYILFMGKDGNIIDYSKISATRGGLTGLGANAFMGSHESLRALGDVNNDGIGDIVVGAQSGSFKGRLIVMCLNSNGTVKQQFDIADSELGFVTNEGDEFGATVANIGDLNNDGTIDLAVDARYALGYGAIYILLMNNDLTVKSHTVISNNMGGFNGVIGSGNFFGMSLENAGDLNDDGVNDILTCSYDDILGTDIGTAWVLFMNSDGTVKAYNKISSVYFPEVEPGDKFAVYNRNLGDLNGDGLEDFSLGTLYLNGKNPNVTGFYFVNFMKYNEYPLNLCEIRGSVFSGNEMVANAKVVLYKDCKEDSVAIDTTFVSDGSYIFDSVEYGNYWVKAIPLSTKSDSKKLEPTYYPMQINLVNCEIGTIDIQLLDFNQFYNIQGTVMVGDTIVTDANVVLYKNNKNDENAIDTILVEDGNFVFTRIIEGNYWIKAEPLYFWSTNYKSTFYPVKIKIDTSNIRDIEIFLDPKEENPNKNSKTLLVCPNPASNYVNICKLPSVDEVVSIEIFNIYGGKVYCDYTLEGHKIMIKVSNLKGGQYKVFIRTGNSVYNETFIVK